MKISFIFFFLYFIGLIFVTIPIERANNDETIILGSDNLQSENFVINKRLNSYFYSVNDVKNDINYKPLQFPKNKTYFNNQTNSDILAENNTEHIWILENNTENGKVYYEIKFNNSIIPENIEIFIFSESAISFVLNDAEIFNEFLIGNFRTDSVSDVFFLINVTNSLSIQPSNYSITFNRPSEGYSFDTAIKLKNGDSPKINIEYSTTNYLETDYFQFNLLPNQRVIIKIAENATNIIKGSRVSLYKPRTGESSPDFETRPTSEEVTDELIQFSYVASNVLGQDNILWLEIRHFQFVKGNYTISLDFQESMYSFETALEIISNITLIDKVDFIDAWPDIRYYKFFVNQSGSRAFVTIKETDSGSGVINNAIAFIYDSGQNTPVENLREDVGRNGVMNGSFYVEHGGYYYIELDLSETRFSGWNFEISITIISPLPFIWKLEFILLTIICLLIIPLLILGYDLYLGQSTHHWDSSGSKSSIFRFISENPRFGEREEIPNEKMLLTSFTFLGDIILEFTSSDEEETVVTLKSANKSFLRFFYYFPIGILIYWLINYVVFINSRETLVWFHSPDILGFSLVISLLLLVFGIPSLFFIIFRFNYIDTMKKEISYSLKSYVSQTIREIASNKQMSIRNANAMLSYIRVLWNQAKKAFKDQNYSLFIIKADSAVKKLIELRFLQLMGQVSEKLIFEELIEKLRENAFDLPSSKKIEYFRKIRNKVVHSSHLLDEKTAIETFSYYSKFLTRLGLRT
ncbi:MAG: hypothetical protein HeimC3_23240 [Candidatus Heimdallarchaeota archaeon LC_3]|nr:MAG: hypothetical protein HeimC3_23240 [Candidatus Heimdallarchaeota archaeon LC_3]